MERMRLRTKRENGYGSKRVDGEGSLTEREKRRVEHILAATRLSLYRTQVRVLVADGKEIA